MPSNVCNEYELIHCTTILEADLMVPLFTVRIIILCLTTGCVVDITESSGGSNGSLTAGSNVVTTCKDGI